MDILVHRNTSCTLLDSSFTAKTEHENQLEETNRFNEQTPKVRKPYTITKQREKWTEEEHQKFLEAIKLYGRGWRKIEEHIGTKTAIQIRSHAQKFFSKVARETNNGTDGSLSVNLVEIPPPRPKRKPVHPYPRKSSNSLGEALVSSRIESIMANGTPSPRSVLSMAGSESDTSGSAASEDHNGCPSPNSCSTCENESKFQDKVNRSSPLSPQNSLCFKIFGRTVMVTDVTPKISSSLDKESSFDLPDEKLDGTQALNQCNSRCQTPTVGVPPSCPLQWCSYQGLPYVLFAPFNLSLLSNGTVEEQHRASSDSKSITGAGDGNLAHTNSPPRDPGNRETQKGFVPYKRCLAQREGKSSIFLADRRSRKSRVES